MAAQVDFGSLNALLSQGHALTGQKPPLVPVKEPRRGASEAQLPARPQRNALKENALMNKKLAFKMLKQLGCEVKRMPISKAAELAGEEGDLYIDVDSGLQPVLFNMLCDFGYQAMAGPRGRAVIHIEEARRRSMDEVVADLSAPRQGPLAEDAEGWPTTGARPRMDPEQERQMVQRLASRKPPRAVVAASAASEDAEKKDAPKFRSAAELKASLQRLQRRGSSTPDQAAHSAAAHSPAPKAVTAPAALPLQREAPSADREPPISPRGDRRTVRQRSPLAHVGQMAVGAPQGGPSSSHSGEEPVGAREHARARSAPCPAEPPADPAPERQALPALPRVATLAERPTVPEVKDSEWLEKLLGPMADKQGKARTKVQREEQRARLEQLSKPRAAKVAEQEEAAPAPSRSPRAQKEACSRLAVPRKPPAASKEEPRAASAEAAEGSTEAASSEPDEGEPQVVVIRSLLAECQGPLEVIEEDTPPSAPAAASAPAADAQPRRRAASQGLPRTRASASQPAAPYAVPVVPYAPPAPKPQASGGRHQQGSHRGSASPAANADDGDEEVSEDMLANIDRLYTSILKEERERGWGRASPSPAWAASEATRSSSSRAPPPRAAAAAGDASAGEGDESEGSELLLESIDRLYGELLHGEAESAEEGADGRDEGRRPPSAATPEQLCEALEEVLWSSLMLGRGTGGRVDAQARLLELLAPRVLANCHRACVPAGGLPQSLLQRLASELPLVHSALHGASCERPPLVQLLNVLLRARDRLLTLAGSSDINAEELAPAAAPKLEEPSLPERPTSAASASAASSGTQDSAPRRPRPKPRRTGLSHWTPESIGELGAPRRSAAR